MQSRDKGIPGSQRRSFPQQMTGVFIPQNEVKIAGKGRRTNIGNYGHESMKNLNGPSAYSNNQAVGRYQARAVYNEVHKSTSSMPLAQQAALHNDYQKLISSPIHDGKSTKFDIVTSARADHVSWPSNGLADSRNGNIPVSQSVPHLSPIRQTGAHL